MICQCKESTATFFPTSSTDYNTNNHPPGDFFFVKSDNPATFTGVFGDFCGVWRLESTNHSAVRPTVLNEQRVLREPLSRPKALTGGQSLSSLAQQSEQRGDTHPSASRLQMNRACAWPPPFPPWRSSPPRTFVLTSRRVVITTSGAFKSLWSEQDGDLTFLHKIQLFSTTLHL